MTGDPCKHNGFTLEDPGKYMICEGKRGRCRSTGVTHESKMQEVWWYIGETARNVYTRGFGHNSIDKKSKESPFHVHNTEKHGGVGEGVAGFEM